VIYADGPKSVQSFPGKLAVPGRHNIAPEAEFDSDCRSTAGTSFTGKMNENKTKIATNKKYLNM
jgi:hypothetical protein